MNGKASRKHPGRKKPRNDTRGEAVRRDWEESLIALMEYRFAVSSCHCEFASVVGPLTRMRRNPRSLKVPGSRQPVEWIQLSTSAVKRRCLWSSSAGAGLEPVTSRFEGWPRRGAICEMSSRNLKLVSPRRSRLLWRQSKANVEAIGDRSSAIIAYRCAKPEVNHAMSCRNGN